MTSYWLVFGLPVRASICGFSIFCHRLRIVEKVDVNNGQVVTKLSPPRFSLTYSLTATLLRSGPSPAALTLGRTILGVQVVRDKARVERVNLAARVTSD